jgi:hypothetical protein
MTHLVLRKRLVQLVAAGSIAAAAAVGAPVAASAASLRGPLNDSSIVGTLTFCNRADQPMTSGSLYARPFAWKTVASSPAPKHYRASSARATLTVYQPIHFVDPGDWSGAQLTGASSFSNSQDPNVQATNLDQALLGFTQAYPSHWSNLYELRVYYSAPGREPSTSPYAAAVVRVTGSTWTLVEGGGTPCRAGHGTSDETKSFTKKELSKQYSQVPGASDTTSPKPVASPSGKSMSSQAATSPRVGDAAASAAAAASNAASASAATGSSGSSHGLEVGLAIVAVLVIGGSAVLIRRGRSGPRGSS